MDDCLQLVQLLPANDDNFKTNLHYILISAGMRKYDLSSAFMCNKDKSKGDITLELR